MIIASVIVWIFMTNERGRGVIMPPALANQLLEPPWFDVVATADKN